MKQLFLILLLGFSFTAIADTSADHYDRIHLSVSASAKVENDTMIAVLYAEEEGVQAAELSNIVNRKIRQALETVKRYPAIKHQTNSYSSNPVYRNNKITGWRVRQSIRLESQDMTVMSDVLGKLQQQLALQSMQFAVSTASKDQKDKKLIDEALESFEKRARQVAGKLHRKDYRIVDLTISTSGARNIRPQYQMRAMAMEADVAVSPAVSAGEQTVSVSVSGVIELTGL